MRDYQGFLLTPAYILAFSKGDFMKKALTGLQTVSTVLGVVGLAFAGYIIINSLPDLRRYIKISTM